MAAAVLWIRRASRRQARLPFRTPSALTYCNPFALVSVALSPHTSTTHTHPSIHPSTIPQTHPPISPHLSRAETAARKKTVSQRYFTPLPCVSEVAAAAASTVSGGALAVYLLLIIIT